jgi:hypothetical protein
VHAAAERRDAVGDALPLDPQLVVGPVEVALLVRKANRSWPPRPS